MAEHKTSKEKLNEALGISPNSGIDEFLSKLTIDGKTPQETLEQVDSEIKKEVKSLDENLAIAKDQSEFGVIESNESKKALSLVKIDDSLNHINELITISKDVIRHIYENIISNDLVDSELVHAAAAFIESCHLNVKEYLDLYKDRLKFYDKVKLEMLNHQHKMEELQFKHELDMKKLESKVENVPEGMVEFDPEGIVKALSKED